MFAFRVIADRAIVPTLGDVGSHPTLMLHTGQIGIEDPIIRICGFLIDPMGERRGKGERRGGRDALPEADVPPRDGRGVAFLVVRLLPAADELGGRVHRGFRQ